MEENNSSSHYQSRRKDWLVNIIRDSLYFFMSRRYDISYHGIENLESVKNEGFFLIPKHQHNMDIILEGRLLKKGIRRNADYIMKDSLPAWFVYLGGISIIRKQDVTKNNNGRMDKKELVKDAKKQRDYVRKIITDELFYDEILVIHPEGTRNYKTNGELNIPILRTLLHTQKELNKSIPFVPVTIYYQDVKRQGSKIEVHVKKPIIIKDESIDFLVERLKSEIYIK